MIVEMNNTVGLRALPASLVRQLFSSAARTVCIPKQFHFSVGIITDRAIRDMNKTYRGKNTPTDVLSFRYDDQHGEIVISADRVRAQAREYGHAMRTEAAFLLVHGILHIMGWDHERSEKEAREMRGLEERTLRRCGFNYAR